MGAAGFTFCYGERVTFQSPHPLAGLTGFVTNAYLFPSGFEEIFVWLAGAVHRCGADMLKSTA